MADNQPLVCALTGRVLTKDEAYWAQPLITANQLVSTLARTALSNPGGLAAVLSADLPDVPYAPEARELLAKRRSAEQVKLLVGLLLIGALVVLPVLYLLMR